MELTENFVYPSDAKPDDLVVWHIPQIPGNAFVVKVASVEEGRQLSAVLAAYDQFQLDESIKPDYCNVTGISRWESDGETYDWFDVMEDE